LRRESGEGDNGIGEEEREGRMKGRRGEGGESIEEQGWCSSRRRKARQ